MFAKAVVAFLALLSLCLAPRDAAAATDPYLSKYYALIIFAPDAGSVYLARQKEAIASGSAALRTRDVVVVYVVGSEISQDFGPAPNADAPALKAKYGIDDNEFHAILAGKDGTMKLKSPSPLSVDRISGFIDGRPMRGDEASDSTR